MADNTICGVNCGATQSYTELDSTPEAQESLMCVAPRLGGNETGSAAASPPTDDTTEAGGAGANVLIVRFSVVDRQGGGTAACAPPPAQSCFDDALRAVSACGKALGGSPLDVVGCVGNLLGVEECLENQAASGTR